MSVFDPTNRADHTKSLAFLDPNGGVTVQRYDTMKYRQFEKLTEKQLGFLWQPTEIALDRDRNDFKSLQDNEKHIFSSNLMRQILLDSVQGRSPVLAFLPIVSLPEIEAFITTWAYSETIHSRSYTHIIRNVYTNPSLVLDEMMDIQEIVDCAKDISMHYDTLIDFNNRSKVDPSSVDLYQHKRALWLALMSVNVLEGVRFYLSFAASWQFGEMKKMEGNAKIIKLICRDENVHLAATQTLLKLLPKDDPDYVTIAAETRDECIEIFRSAVAQEKAWCDYLFKYGPIVGLNAQLMYDYIEWIANKRMTAIGLPALYKAGPNPLPWTQKWIAGSEVQVAPQEVESSSYTISQTVQDVSSDTFNGFSL